MNRTDPDPDANYFNSIQIPQSRYVTSYDLNTLLQKISYRNKFSLFHANCRSVAKKKQQSFVYHYSFESSVSVIAVSETWLKPGRESLYSTIPNYSFIARSRTTSAGGGVGLYIIHNDYAWSRFWMYICGTYWPKCIVGCIYGKPDTDIKTFNVSLDRLLIITGTVITATSVSYGENGNFDPQ